MKEETSCFFNIKSIHPCVVSSPHTKCLRESINREVKSLTVDIPLQSVQSTFAYTLSSQAHTWVDAGILMSQVQERTLHQQEYA